MSTSLIGQVTAGLALTGLAVLGTASGASAQEACAYGQTCPTTITDSTPAPGQRVTVSSGAGTFDPGSSVTITVFGSSRTVTANASGSASASFSVPDGQSAGGYRAVFSGTRDGASASVTVSFTVVSAVSASTSVSGSSLPTTGTNNLVPLGVAGLTLVGAGAGLVVVTRRRRHTSPAA